MLTSPSACGARGETVAGDEEYGPEHDEEGHKGIAVAVDETERSDADVEQADQDRDDERPTITYAQALPDPQQCDAERQHAAANEIPDDVDHRVQAGLDRELVQSLMNMPCLQAVAERTQPD